MTNEQSDQGIITLASSISSENQKLIKSDAQALAVVLAASKTQELKTEIKELLQLYLEQRRRYSRLRILRQLTSLLDSEEAARFITVMLEWHHSKMPSFLKDNLKVDVTVVEFVRKLYGHFGNAFRFDSDAVLEPRDWAALRLNVFLKAKGGASTKTDFEPFVELYFDRNDGTKFDILTPVYSLLEALTEMISEMSAYLEYLPESDRNELNSLEKKIQKWSEKLNENNREVK